MDAKGQEACPCEGMAVRKHRQLGEHLCSFEMDVNKISFDYFCDGVVREFEGRKMLLTVGLGP